MLWMWKMLKSLRWKLTFLYLLIAIGLVGLVGIGTYVLIDRYFQQTTDLALRYKMASQFRLLGLKLPAELAQSETTWLQNNNRTIRPNPTVAVKKDSGDDDDHDDGQIESHGESDGDHDYEADLAAVFVVSLDQSGNPVLASDVVLPPTANDPDVVATVLRSGSDLRTVDMPGQGRMRVLTYRTGVAVPAMLQTGRLLGDQDRALRQYMIFLLFLGGSTAILLTFVSWWLAGRSLGPAQKAWDQQQMFVSNASHELRTPLTLIRATADYGRRSQSLEERGNLLQDILEECDYMDRLVDDLLLLSRLDAHRLKLDLQSVSLANIFAETVRQMSKLADARNISVVVGSDAGSVRADAARLRQVLLILFDNALRFTLAGGSIHLSAYRDGKWMCIELADTGKGIDSQYLPHLFDRFYQVPADGDDSSRSNGLGLSIAKGLIEAQSGSIRIDSTPGKGTRVSLFLPPFE
jgi:signal transduction histidine kinase